MLKFIYSEKATKFCEIFNLLLTTVHTVKSKVKISQNFVAFSEYMNFNNIIKNLVKIFRSDMKLQKLWDPLLQMKYMKNWENIWTKPILMLFAKVVWSL